jgi:hypothetical protein
MPLRFLFLIFWLQECNANLPSISIDCINVQVHDLYGSEYHFSSNANDFKRIGLGISSQFCQLHNLSRQIRVDCIRWLYDFVMKEFWGETTTTIGNYQLVQSLSDSGYIVEIPNHECPLYFNISFEKLHNQYDLMIALDEFCLKHSVLGASTANYSLLTSCYRFIYSVLTKATGDSVPLLSDSIIIQYLRSQTYSIFLQLELQSKQSSTIVNFSRYDVIAPESGYSFFEYFCIRSRANQYDKDCGAKLYSEATRVVFGHPVVLNDRAVGEYWATFPIKHWWIGTDSGTQYSLDMEAYHAKLMVLNEQILCSEKEVDSQGLIFDCSMCMSRFRSHLCWAIQDDRLYTLDGERYMSPCYCLHNSLNVLSSSFWRQQRPDSVLPLDTNSRRIETIHLMNMTSLPVISTSCSSSDCSSEYFLLLAEESFCGNVGHALAASSAFWTIIADHLENRDIGTLKGVLFVAIDEDRCRDTIEFVQYLFSIIVWHASEASIPILVKNVSFAQLMVKELTLLRSVPFELSNMVNNLKPILTTEVYHRVVNRVPNNLLSASGFNLFLTSMHRACHLSNGVLKTHRRNDDSFRVLIAVRTKVRHLSNLAQVKSLVNLWLGINFPTSTVEITLQNLGLISPCDQVSLMSRQDVSNLYCNRCYLYIFNLYVHIFLPPPAAHRGTWH